MPSKYVLVSPALFFFRILYACGITPRLTTTTHMPPPATSNCDVHSGKNKLTPKRGKQFHCIVKQWNHETLMKT